MKQQLFRAGVALAAMLAVAGTAAAEGEWSGNVALSTDYVWRGVSQSNEDMAISGGFDYANGIFYAGTWASNIDFEDGSDSNVELDLYAGVASEFSNGVSWDLGVIYYSYPDSDDEDLDFVELQAALGYAFEGGVEVGGAVYWDPDNESVYVEGSAGYASATTPSMVAATTPTGRLVAPTRCQSASMWTCVTGIPTSTVRTSPTSALS